MRENIQENNFFVQFKVSNLPTQAITSHRKDSLNSPAIGKVKLTSREKASEVYEWKRL